MLSKNRRGHVREDLVPFGGTPVMKLRASLNWIVNLRGILAEASKHPVRRRGIVVELPFQMVTSFLNVPSYILFRFSMSNLELFCFSGVHHVLDELVTNCRWCGVSSTARYWEISPYHWIISIRHTSHIPSHLGV